MYFLRILSIGESKSIKVQIENLGRRLLNQMNIEKNENIYPNRQKSASDRIHKYINAL